MELVSARQKVFVEVRVVKELQEVVVGLKMRSGVGLESFPGATVRREPLDGLAED